MADEIDMANLHAEREREIALANLKPMPREPHVGPCVECGEPVEERRAAVGFSTCISCARELERAQAEAVRRGRVH